MKEAWKIILILMLAFCCIGCNNAAVPIESSAEMLESTTETEPVLATEETVLPTEPELEASLIQEGVKVFVDNDDWTEVVRDGRHRSCRAIFANQKLTIESETPFSSLYLQWNEVPGPYSIVWDGGSVECGRYGFLHEYIQLPEPVGCVRFAFEDQITHNLCEVDVLTEGYAPKGIQTWLPPCEEADILIFPTHSDDDTLFFGTLIAYYAIERQLVIQTAFMVEHTYYPERGHERLNGLWEMGIRHYPILGTAQDSPISNFNEAMAFYGDYHIRQWQVEQIRRFRPLVVVGHDLNGEYGNGGHKVNAYYLVQAVEQASDPDAYPELTQKYGTWDVPKLYLHLYPQNVILMDVETVLQNDPYGRTAFEIAEDAYDHHVSQHKWGYYHVQYNADPAMDCRPFGLYRTLVGLDTTADIMDNIDATQWRSTDVGA